MLLVLNLPLVGIWVQLLRTPYRILFPLILLFCLIGVYSLNSSTVEIYIMIIFGVIGYLTKKTRYEVAPLVLATVLGPMFENAFRQSLMMEGGNLGIFFSRPISCGFILTAIFLLFTPLIFKKGLPQQAN